MTGLGKYSVFQELSSWAQVQRLMTPEKGNLHPLIRMMVKAGNTGGRGEKGIYDFHTDVLKKSLHDKPVN